MTITEMVAELAKYKFNYFIHYNSYSKQYRVSVPWRDIDYVDKELDVALRQVLMILSREVKASNV